MPYRFGGFLLDPATRQLAASGAERHLSPKAFDLLVFLVSNRSRAIAKGELQQHLWPETFVEETNLAGLVAEVRRALDDPASSPRYVRTVYGFGYRFIADVTVQDDPPRPASSRARCYLVSTKSEMMLMEGPNVIGRAPDATIQLDSPGVSRHHARILVSGAEATLEDVSSKNGTYLDGTRIASPVPLSDGSQIRIGTVLLTFRVTTPTAPTATAAAE
jgi:DNA-binding winged helix-turn-helix (wHTH) protein